MHFAAPVYLWIAAFILPALAFFLWWSWRRKEEAIGLFVRSRLLASLTVGVSRGRQILKRIVVWWGAAFLLLALAQPQWGYREEQVRTKGLDVILAIDTSRSMLAEDVRPNRLDRAKLAALDFLDIASSDRIGLVAFAGSAYLQCPLTLDEEAFRSTLSQLDTTIIPQGGTAIAEAIDTSVKAFSEEGGSRAVILITDGEDHEQGALEAARRASSAGVKIFTLGVGTPNGELLFTSDPFGNKVFLKDSTGAVVKSRLDESLLKSVAEAADGFYLPLQNRQTIATLYERGLAPLPRSEGAVKSVRQMYDRFQIPLAIAILLFIVEIFIPEHRRVMRSEDLMMAENTELKRSVVQGVATLAVFVSIFLGPKMQASSTSARSLYNRGKYDEAQSEYERLSQKHPDDPRFSFNAGVAAYRGGHLEDAASRFEKALSADELKLQEGAYYNLGNTQYQMGAQADAIEEKLKHWRSSVGNLSSAVKLNPNDADAIHNLQWVQRQLEELEKQMPRQPQQQENDKSDPKDKQDKQDKQEKQDKSDSSQQNRDSSEKQDSASQDQQQAQQGQDPQKDEEKKSSANADKEEKDSQKRANEKSQQGREGEKEEANASKGETDGKDKQEQSAEAPQSGEGTAGDESGHSQDGKMTPAMAERLLDAQKGKEKAMLFRLVEPKEAKARTRKDW